MLSADERLENKDSQETNQRQNTHRKGTEFSTNEPRETAVHERSADEVMEFAQQHHPELASLLKHLAGAKSPEFKRAISQLSTEIARLDRVKERTPQRFETELDVWKLESKTRLLLARHGCHG